MRGPTILLAVFALTCSASAQLVPIDFSHNWLPLHNGVAVGFSGTALFGAYTTVSPEYAGPGDAIRRCYGVDNTQGGRHYTAGSESTHYKLGQGYAAANPIQGVDIGLVSVQSGSDSDLRGDACFSPFFASAGNQGGHAVSAAALIGLITGTGGFPFPTVWELAFRWMGTSTYQGVPSPNVIGVDRVFGNPLLANVIFEIQGPVNGGPTNQQYYLASTGELTGRNALTAPGNLGGTGGVTNGNSNWGLNVFGVTADVSGAISHSRILASDSALGMLMGGAPPFLSQPGDVELVGHLAFQAPVLWATNDGQQGAGGADWRVSTPPVSNVTVYLLDQLSGGELNSDVLYKVGGGGPPGPAYDPNIAYSAAVFLYSCTPSSLQPQLPYSWSSLLGSPLPGSQVMAFATSREGAQRAAVEFDACTATMLRSAQVSVGTTFTGSDDLFIAGGTAGGASSFFEGMFGQIISGVSSWQKGGPPAIGNPLGDPALAGFELGVSAGVFQVNSATGFVGVAEVGSSIELNMQ